MKKVISFILTVLLAFPMCSFSFASATQKEVFDDGSYITVGFGYDEDGDGVTDEEDASPESESNNGLYSFVKKILDLFRKIINFISGKKDVSRISKTKYVRYHDSAGNVLWTVYLTAAFSYDGEMSECTGVTYSYDIKDSDWSLLSAGCDKSSNTAKGTFKVRQYKLGVPLKQIEKTITIKCDKNGNIE